MVSVQTKTSLLRALVRERPEIRGGGAGEGGFETDLWAGGVGRVRRGEGWEKGGWVPRGGGGDGLHGSSATRVRLFLPSCPFLPACMGLCAFGPLRGAVPRGDISAQGSDLCHPCRRVGMPILEFDKTSSGSSNSASSKESQPVAQILSTPGP